MGVILIMFERLWQLSFLYISSAFKFYIKNCTEILHTAYKGNVPSFQCKMSLDRSTSMGEIEGLNLIFIDLHILALTARFN
jgi:hypothetical protein